MKNQFTKFTPNFMEDEAIKRCLIKYYIFALGALPSSGIPIRQKSLLDNPSHALYNLQSEIIVSADASFYGFCAIFLKKANMECLTNGIHIINYFSNKTDI